MRGAHLRTVRVASFVGSLWICDTWDHWMKRDLYHMETRISSVISSAEIALLYFPPWDQKVTWSRTLFILHFLWHSRCHCSIYVAICKTKKCAVVGRIAVRIPWGPHINNPNLKFYHSYINTMISLI